MLLLSRVWLFVIPWTAPRQAFLSFTHLPELAQTHVHWVSDTIQPSHPLLSPSPPAFKTFPWFTNQKVVKGIQSLLGLLAKIKRRKGYTVRIPLTSPFPLFPGHQLLSARATNVICVLFNLSRDILCTTQENMVTSPCPFLFHGGSILDASFCPLLCFIFFLT